MREGKPAPGRLPRGRQLRHAPTTPLLDLLPALLGPFVGSFIGLLSVRLPAGERIVAGRSCCRSCGRRLGPLELVPLVGFAALRGRCAGCGARISSRYPLLELACLLLGLSVVAVDPWPMNIVDAGLGWWLLLIAVIDQEHLWLPDGLTLPLLAAVLAATSLADPHRLPDHLIGAAAGFLVLAGLAALYRRVRGREGLGDGDPRLLAAGGAWVGWMGLPSVIIWATLFALALVLARSLAGRAIAAEQPLAFGGHLAAGIWLTWLLGPLTIGR